MYSSARIVIMNKPSTAEILILGILYDNPMHGYDLDRLINDRGIRQWADIGFSSIYYLLDKLEAKGLVSTLGAEGKSKKAFSITYQGKEICVEQSKLLISQREANKNPFMTGLANSDFMDNKVVSSLLAARLENINSQLADLQEKAQAQDSLTPSAQRLFSYSEMQIKSEANWIKDQLNNIEELA